MKYRVHIISDAEEDLFEIYKYVFSNDSPDKAEKLFSNLHRKCLTLENFADRGHLVPEMVLLGLSDFRELIYKPYRIIYNILDENVFIHCIPDSRREIQSILQERFLRNIE